MSPRPFRETKWGQACVAISEEMAKRWPGLQFAIGPDDNSSTAAAPVVTFTHDNGETVQPALRGGAGAASRHPFDRMPLIGFECWGRDPVESEELFEEMLLALDAVAHGRASKPGTAKPEIGSLTSGQLGTKYTGSFAVRIAVATRPARTAAPTSSEYTGGAAAPDDSDREVGITYPEVP